MDIESILVTATVETDRIILELALVLIGAAVLSWLAIVAKQPMIIAYIVCGVVMGPHALNWIQGDDFIKAISTLGVVLLLFLAGVVLHPRRLLQLFRKSTPVALLNSAGSPKPFATSKASSSSRRTTGR